MVKDEIKTYVGYIYKITNVETNKIYIGLTRRTVLKRFKQHLSCAFRESSSSYSTYLSRSIRKHGTDKFIVETIKTINATSLGQLCKQLDKEEIFYIKEYNSTDKDIGYNSLKGGQINCLTEEEILQKQKTNILHIGCCVPGCNGIHLANGYCQKHYNQIYKFGSILERTIYDHNEIVYYIDYAELILYDKNCIEHARTKIDLDDVDLVKDIKWSYHESSRGVQVVANKPKIELHNYLLNHTDKTKVVMHKNGDNLDNRKSNLIIVSQVEKQQNHKIHKNNKSGVSGVWWCKSRNKWQAQITINNKQKSLGRFLTFEEAVAARKAAEKVYYNKWEDDDSLNLN